MNIWTLKYLFSQLILRLHNVERGDMRIENANIDAVNVPWLRSKLGLISQVNMSMFFDSHKVNQEPVLFNRSIAENISYGDMGRNTSKEQVYMNTIHYSSYNTLWLRLSRRPGLPSCTPGWPPCPRAMTPGWGWAGVSSQWARGRGSPSPGLCSGRRGSCCWTKPLQLWTLRMKEQLR